MYLLIPLFFFFSDPATAEIYTLSLHDALPISTLRMSAMVLFCLPRSMALSRFGMAMVAMMPMMATTMRDRKSIRLHSRSGKCSYAARCSKNKQKDVLHRASALPTIDCLLDGLG